MRTKDDFKRDIPKRFVGGCLLYPIWIVLQTIFVPLGMLYGASKRAFLKGREINKSLFTAWDDPEEK